MSTVRTVPISVPSWTHVTIHITEEHRYPADPVPDLGEACEEALIERRLLVGMYRLDDEGDTEHPFMVSGAAGPYYAYRDDDTDRHHPQIGRLASTYGFWQAPPARLDVAYDYDHKDADFEIAIDTAGQHVLLMEAAEKPYALALGAPGDSLLSVMARVSAAVFVLDNLDGIYAADVLPYTKDTRPIATARLAHILRWQFETSRIRPLYA